MLPPGSGKYKYSLNTDLNLQIKKIEIACVSSKIAD
jgi:hypothetical protein